MELHDWALRILSSGSLEDKFFQPESLTDDNPGNKLIIAEPARAPSLRFQKRSKKEKLPPFHDLGKEENRAICLHRFAGHELLAIEIMAFALLAFPDAPATFRKGVAHTLKEEQGHLKLYCERMAAMGLKFGELPLYRNFWTHTPFITTPLHYVSTLPLTLEMANLDFAPMYGKAFLRYGDEPSAQLMAEILADEINHVRFGLQWLRKMIPENQNEWDAWTKVLSTTLLTPKRAKGFLVHKDPRRKAGVTEDWIENLDNFSLHLRRRTD